MVLALQTVSREVGDGHIFWHGSVHSWGLSQLQLASSSLGQIHCIELRHDLVEQTSLHLGLSNGLVNHGGVCCRRMLCPAMVDKSLFACNDTEGAAHANCFDSQSGQSGDFLLQVFSHEHEALNPAMSLAIAPMLLTHLLGIASSLNQPYFTCAY